MHVGAGYHCGHLGLHLWAALGDSVGHEPQSYSTWCNRAGLLHQLLAVPECGQSISGTDRASHTEMHAVAVGSCAGDSEMGMVGQ